LLKLLHVSVKTRPSSGSIKIPVMKLLLFFFPWCGGMRLYAHVMPVFSIDAPAVSGVVLELWPSVFNFITGIFILPEDGQVLTETCRSFSKF